MTSQKLNCDLTQIVRAQLKYQQNLTTQILTRRINTNCHKTQNSKGLNVSFISTDHSTLQQTNVPCSCARSCLFYQKFLEYWLNTRVRWPWGPWRGLYRMEVVSVTTFFSQKFPKSFFGKIYMNQKQFDW